MTSGHRSRHRRLALAGFVVALLWAGISPYGVRAALQAGTTAPGQPLTQARCPGVVASVKVFRPAGVPYRDWREELAFDGHGGMWVSHMQDNHLERYDAGGVVRQIVVVPGPGGLAVGPDGLIYANAAGIPKGPGVVRFDPTQARPTPAVFVSGLPGVNASTFDRAGFLYVSTEGNAPSVLRLRPDGTRDTAWEQRAAFYGANGVTVAGPNLYAAISFDQRSPMERVPLADPAAHRTFAQLSFGALSRQPAVHAPDPRAPLLPKGLDDLTVGPDGQLYVVGFVSGELLRVDPATGQACVLASGLTAPTAVQFPVAFGSFDPRRDPFVTEATGRIVRVHLSG